jgi:hypothetical protein
LRFKFVELTQHPISLLDPRMAFGFRKGLRALNPRIRGDDEREDREEK